MPYDKVPIVRCDDTDARDTLLARMPDDQKRRSFANPTVPDRAPRPRALGADARRARLARPRAMAHARIPQTFPPPAACPRGHAATLRTGQGPIKICRAR